MKNTKNIEVVKREIKEVIIEVLRLEITPDDIKDDQSFFGTEEDPESGIIEDSLVILEIATILSEKYDIPPTDFNEETFTNVNSLADLAMKALNEE